MKNGLRIGKRIEYYSNSKIKYDGDWIDDATEGNGKYIYDDGYYFIWLFKNGLKQGIGTYHYSDRKIIYDDDWIKDVAEGNGKEILEDDRYYIG